MRGDDLKLIDILLVEDNPADARLIKDYFKNSPSKISIDHVNNGSMH